MTDAAIPQRALVLSVWLTDGLGPRAAAKAIARGLRAGGQPEPDILALEQPGSTSSEVRELLDRSGFDERMRASRALVVAAPRLHERTLAASVTFEVATRARQGGVPAYALTGENALNAFDARILDLQLILEASTTRGLAKAAEKLARVV